MGFGILWGWHSVGSFSGVWHLGSVLADPVKQMERWARWGSGGDANPFVHGAKKREAYSAHRDHEKAEKAVKAMASEVEAAAQNVCDHGKVVEVEK